MSRVAAAGRELVEVLGDKELIAAFESLATKAQARAARRALSAGMRMLRDAIKSEVRPAKSKGHTNRNIRDGVGARQGRRRGGEYEAKAGLQVGKRTARRAARAAAAPHAHLVALGTVDRYTGSRTRRTRGGRVKVATGKTRSFRGRMPADDFVVRGTAKASASAQLEMVRVMWDVIEQEAAKNAQP